MCICINGNLYPRHSQVTLCHSFQRVVFFVGFGVSKMFGLCFSQQISVTNVNDYLYLSLSLPMFTSVKFFGNLSQLNGNPFQVNKTVRRLDYEGNTAGAEGMAYLSDMLAENIYITDLVRKSFQLSITLARNSPNLCCYYCFIKNCHFQESNLTQISPQNLAYNGLGSKGLSCLVEAMEANDTIEKLNISGQLHLIMNSFEYNALFNFKNIFGI